MSAARLIDRLERVKQTAPGRWIACCPGHADRSPSLGVRELDDGRVLLHCFAGCEVGDVLAAVGLQFADLFPEKIGHHFPPSRSRIPARDILACVSEEIDVAAIILNAADGHTIGPVAMRRLALAAARIGEARNHVA